jgi:hypothetical protein
MTICHFCDNRPTEVLVFDSDRSQGPLLVCSEHTVVEEGWRIFSDEESREQVRNLRPETKELLRNLCVEARLL